MVPTKSLLSWSAAILLVVACVGAPASAQAGVNGGGQALAAAAPDDVFAFLSFAGIGNCSKAAENLGLYKLWREEEVQEFLKKALSLYDRANQGASDRDVEMWGHMKQALGGRVSVIVGGLTLMWARYEPIPIPVPGCVVAIDVGGRREAFEGFLAQVLQAPGVTRAMRGVTQSTTTYAGREVKLYQVERRSPVHFTICTTYVDNLFLIGLNKPLLYKCLDNLEGKGAKTLKDLPSFKRARSKNTANPLLEVFVNVDGITSRFRGLLPDEVKGALHDLGLDGVNAMYYATTVHDGDGFDTVYVDAPAPRRGLLDLGSSPVSAETLAMVPSSAVYFEAWPFEIGKAWDVLMKTAASVVPPRYMKMVHGSIAEVEREIGVSLRGDVLAALGSEVMYYAELPRNGAVPTLVATLEIRDRAKAEKVLASAIEMAHLEARDVRFGDHVMKVVKVPDQDVPLAPALAFVGNRLLIASTPAGLKAAIRRGSKPGKSITDNPSFQETFVGLDWKNASGLVYVDVKRGAAFGYNFLENLTGVIPEEVPLDLALLPSEESLLQHLKGMGGASYCDQDGIVCKVRWPFTGASLAAGARLIDQAPGFPPRAVEKMLAQVFGPMFGRTSHRRSTRGRPVAAPARPMSAPAVSGSSIVNPLRKGDPEEQVWRDRLAELNQQIAKNGKDGGLFFQRGITRTRLRHFAAALLDYKRAYGLGARKSTTAYNVACCYSLLGKRDEAFQWLGRAVTDGFSSINHLRNDSDLDNIRKDPRFAAVLAKLSSH